MGSGQIESTIDRWPTAGVPAHAADRSSPRPEPYGGPLPRQRRGPAATFRAGGWLGQPLEAEGGRDRPRAPVVQ
eukprot:scaffold377_cov563-Prasinococcus_capsulatus_cf.AAC.20